MDGQGRRSSTRQASENSRAGLKRLPCLAIIGPRHLGALREDYIEVYVALERNGDFTVFHALRPPGEGGEGQACRKGKERKMAKQVTSDNQEDIDAMIRAADRGELIHHPEAAVRRDPGAPLLTDEQAASLMAQSLANLEKLEERRAEARTARRT